MIVRTPRGGSKGVAASMEVQPPRAVGMLVGQAGGAGPSRDLLRLQPGARPGGPTPMFVLVNDHLGQHIPNGASTEFNNVWQHSTSGPASFTPPGL